MSIIPTRVHGYIDYLMGVLLIAAPWVLRFNDNRAATMVPVVLGLGIIVYSVLTRYELGLIPVIPMPVHLWIDILGGLVLLASPWLFGFSGRIIWPHVLFGILEVGVAAITQRIPSMVRGTREALEGDTDVRTV